MLGRRTSSARAAQSDAIPAKVPGIPGRLSCAANSRQSWNHGAADLLMTGTWMNPLRLNAEGRT